MDYIPTYICPNCGKVMKIHGTQCPYCRKIFTVEEIDKMFFVCPTCHSDIIEILLCDSNSNPQLGLTVRKARYSAVIDIAKGAVGSNLQNTYICKNCGTKFNSENFLLMSKLENAPQKGGYNSTKSLSWSNIWLILLSIIIVLIVGFIVLFC